MNLVKSTLLTSLFTGVLFMGLPTAHEHDHGVTQDHPEKASMPATDTTGTAGVTGAKSMTGTTVRSVARTTALAGLDAFLDSVNTDLSAGKMNRIHEFAEKMNETIKNLDQDTTLVPTKKKRVQGYIKNIAKITDSMHDAADAKKLDETKKWAKKLKVQADLMDKQFTTKSKN